MSGPANVTFEPSNDQVRERDWSWVKVPDDYPCRECRERGGWLPQVWQSACPECYGEDPYGQASFCAECEYCCGC